MRAFFSFLLITFLFLPDSLSAQQVPPTPPQPPGEAQEDRQPTMNRAAELLRLGNYQQAYEMYQELLQRAPNSVPAAEGAMQALMNLREYEEAEHVYTQFVRKNGEAPQLRVVLAEIYHMKGDQEKAYELWDSIISDDRRNVQLYRRVAESMANRSEHERAARMLIRARELMNNENLFAFDVANLFSGAGLVEESMREFSRLISQNAGYMRTIQRQLSRFSDREYMDEAIISFEEISNEMTPGSEAWASHRYLLIWLYTERELYRRALVTARDLENHIGEREFPVFEVGQNLAALDKFELAQEAFQYYSDRSDHPLFERSREEKARLYVRWAHHLNDNYLDFGGKAEELFAEALGLLGDLKDNRRYQRLPEVLILMGEIALDHKKDAEAARPLLEQLRSVSRTEDHDIQADYLEGRLYIFDGAHSRARVALSRANRKAGTGELAEKTRYFLALNDFYTEDFEYARLQLRSLQRQNTSWYANPALRLRTWLQDGVIQGTVMDELKIYARARYHFDTGNFNESMQELLPIIERTSAPLKTDATLLAARILRDHQPGLGFAVLEQFRLQVTQSSQMERIFWERARLADAIISPDGENPRTRTEALNPELAESVSSLISSSTKEKLILLFSMSTDELFFEGGSTSQTSAEMLEKVTELYEDMILEFPRGFYASPARDRVRELRRLAEAA